MHQGSVPANLKPMFLFHMLYNESLELAAQPIVNLRTGRVEAVEILSRAPGGVLRPDEMFSLARQYGVLEQLTLLSCRKLTQKIQTIKPFLEKGLFFNIEADVSKQTLEQTVRIFKFSCEDTVVLEVTEHMPSGFAWRHFTDQLGVAIAMDDLGRGNSNMVELMRMRPHFVKICMELVRDLHKSGAKSLMIENFKQIGDLFNMQLIAEGIELLEDLQKLREIGIEYGQGYYFSRPCPIDQVPVDEWKIGYQAIIK
ncbi:EAL domain-containing protein [Effusibacillus pohliae]|uniref:EAL domain-containing protein n=1 Tax=Effusibacillus pohliae TaxID=232270 RepID=UPI0004771D19|nr:EAL domain-containing protein [Effusibacillus pohliae]